MTKHRSAIADFFHVNYEKLLHYVRSRLCDTAERSGEDIVQDVMLRLLDRPDVVAPIADLSGYVFRSLRNRIIDIYRSPDRSTVSLDGETEDGLSLFDVLPDERYQPESSYHRRSLRILVFELIRELPRSQMEVIVETEFNQRSFRELSEEWKVPVGTLLARKHRGMAAVRKKLEKLQEDGNG